MTLTITYKDGVEIKFDGVKVKFEDAGKDAPQTSDPNN